MASTIISADALHCDVCAKDNLPAVRDAPTVYGPWAYMCDDCYPVIANLDFPPTLLLHPKGTPA